MLIFDLDKTGCGGLFFLSPFTGGILSFSSIFMVYPFCEREVSLVGEKLNVAVAGVGNYASSLIQGIEYYRQPNDTNPLGLIHGEMGGILKGWPEVIVVRRRAGTAHAFALRATSAHEGE